MHRFRHYSVYLSSFPVNKYFNRLLRYIDVCVRCVCMIRNANELFCAKIYNEQQIGNWISIEKNETDIERRFFSRLFSYLVRTIDEPKRSHHNSKCQSSLMFGFLFVSNSFAFFTAKKVEWNGDVQKTLLKRVSFFFLGKRAILDSPKIECNSMECA